MKSKMLAVTATAIMALTLGALAESAEPGLVDFGKFAPSASGREFVEVNLSSGILSIAAKLVPKEEAEIAKLLSGLQQVRVNVIGLDDGNREQITKQAEKIKASLAAEGWERIVTAQQKAEDVGVYLKTLGKDAIAGLAVIVMDGKKEAVFVNIVGNIKAEQIATLGERLNIDPLKKIGRGTQKETPPAKE
jgi:Skp family chaperone for outer membrane proteins